MKWKTVYDCYLNWLHFALNAEVEYLCAPYMGIIVIHSKRRLTNKDVAQFDMELSDEKNWVQGEFAYTSFLRDKQAGLIRDWADKNRDAWSV